MLAAGAGTLWAGSNIRNYKQQVRPCSVRGCTSIVFKQLIPNVSEVRAAHVLEKQQTKMKYIMGESQNTQIVSRNTFTATSAGRIEKMLAGLF